MMNPNLSKKLTDAKSGDFAPVNAGIQIKMILEKWTQIQGGFQVVLRHEVQPAWTECIIPLAMIEAFTLEKYSMKFDQYKHEDQYFEQPADQHLSSYLEENIASIIEAYIISCGKVTGISQFHNPIEINLSAGPNQLSILDRANIIGNLKLIKSRVDAEANALIEMLISNLVKSRKS